MIHVKLSCKIRTWFWRWIYTLRIVVANEKRREVAFLSCQLLQSNEKRAVRDLRVRKMAICQFVLSWRELLRVWRVVRVKGLFFFWITCPGRAQAMDLRPGESLGFLGSGVERMPNTRTAVFSKNPHMLRWTPKLTAALHIQTFLQELSAFI